jgi:hypothetical protein
VPDDDLVFDDFRNLNLKSFKRGRGAPFFCEILTPKSVQEFEEQALERAKQLIFLK